MVYRIVQPDGESHCLLRAGDRLYLQTAGDEIRRLLAPDQLRQIERAHMAEVEQQLGLTS